MTPFAKGKDGSEIKNPLKDMRVRKAMSKAINRDAIVSRVMEGVAIPAGQFLPDGYFGVSTKLKPVAYDPEGAKKLLAEAGFPNGFKLTLHGAQRPLHQRRQDRRGRRADAHARRHRDRDRDAAAGRVLHPRVPGRPGRHPGVQLHPGRLGLGHRREFGPLKPLVATFDKDKGTGAANRGRYSNPEVDKLIAEALKTDDDAKRAELLAQGDRDRHRRRRRSFRRHYQVNTWAARKGLKYKAALGRVHARHGRVARSDERRRLPESGR